MTVLSMRAAAEEIVTIGGTATQIISQNSCHKSCLIRNLNLSIRVSVQTARDSFSTDFTVMRLMENLFHSLKNPNGSELKGHSNVTDGAFGYRERERQKFCGYRFIREDI